MKRCYIPDYRFSEDLDFTLTENVSFGTIRRELDTVFEEARRAAGINFSFLRYEEQQNTHTFYVGYVGPLPTTSPKEVKVDSTIRELVIFPPCEREVLRGYDEFEDLPNGVTVPTYTLDEIAVEKVVALMDPARNEPRDLYDVWYLCEQGHVRLDALVGAVEEKLRFRGKQLKEVRMQFDRKEDRYRRSWETRLAGQMVQLPEFDQVHRAVRRQLRRAGLGPP